MWGRGAPGGAVPKTRQRRTPGTPPTGEVGEEERDRGGVSGGGGGRSVRRWSGRSRREEERELRGGGGGGEGHTLQEGQEVEMEHRTMLVSPRPHSAGQ